MANLIVMPRLSPTMEEGVLARWLKKEGDKIAPGDIIAEVETDKANMDFPLEDEGVLLKQLCKAGDTIKLGAPVGILGEPGEDFSDLLAEAEQGGAPAAAPAAPAAAAPAPAAAAPAPAPVQPPADAQTVVVAETAAGRILASPLARRLADDAGLDIRRIAGSGPGGRIIKRDIEKAIAEKGAAGKKPAAPAAQAAPSAAPAQVAAPAPAVYTPPPALSAQDESVSLPMIRRIAAKRLVEAKQAVPHIYLTTDAAVDALWQFREQLNQTGQASGDKISFNDLVLKALARALRVVPSANMSFGADGQTAIRHHRVDISVAVALSEGEGLITPVVRNAAEKSIGALAREVRELAQRGRDKKLRPEEYTGGTFSLTNLGMYGVREFCAIINPPESGILAVGRIEKRPVVVEKDGHDEVVVQRRMTMTLSCDHRIMDGALGAMLLAEVVRGLEHPMLLVL
jgi:pyruvate dehydrogenase E2 component (dihydrolipoamide acetyltransferase)